MKVFQDKDQRFYGEYLNKFEPMRIAAQTKFADENEAPSDVFFLLTGCILKESEIGKRLGIKKTYLIEGSIFGEGDVLCNRPRRESYTTITDCYVLKLSKDVFNEIMDEFDDFKAEVTTIAKEREIIRVA